jgi:hypothetical protein
LGKLSVKGVEIETINLNGSAIFTEPSPPMPTPLRRLLNHLPIPHGSGELYVRSSWHKPTPFGQWLSQPPFRPTLKANHFARSLRRRRLVRALVRCGVGLGVAWIVIESARAVALF